MKKLFYAIDNEDLILDDTHTQYENPPNALVPRVAYSVRFQNEDFAFAFLAGVASSKNIPHPYHGRVVSEYDYSNEECGDYSEREAFNLGRAWALKIRGEYDAFFDMFLPSYSVVVIMWGAQ